MMLFLLAILPFLRTVHGSPVTVLTIDTIKISESSTRDLCPDASDNFRSTSQIVFSCLLTIFACVWTGGHSNIGGPIDGNWTRLKRRGIMMFCTLIAPELIAFWAMRQNAAAKNIAKKYNAEILGITIPPTSSNVWCLKRLGKWILSVWNNQKKSFIDMPPLAAKRRNDIPWTNTHGFFVQMGGFLLYEGENLQCVLDYNALKTLILKKKIDRPIITDSDIEDRSKGDGLSKGFVVLQTTWFVIQCLTRLQQHLPLTELEVVTLGFAVLNAIVYAVWWSKPQGVGVAICLYLKSKHEDEKNAEIESSPASPIGTCAKRAPTLDDSASSSTAGTFQTVNDIDEAGMIPEGAIGVMVKTRTNCGELDTGSSTAVVDSAPAPNIRQTWMRRMLEEDRTSHDHHWLFVRLVMAPFRFLRFALSPFEKMILDNSVPPGAVRVPMFYADVQGEGITKRFKAASCVIGLIFGAIHLIPWSSAFPSETERFIWRISSLIVSVTPVFFLILGILDSYQEAPIVRIIQDIIVVPLIFGIPFYILARLALISIAFLSPRSISPQSHLSIPWTSFIPHL